MGKKIVLISSQDHAGSGYRIAEAVGLNTKHFVEYIVLLDDSSGHISLKYPYLYTRKKGKTDEYEIDRTQFLHIQKIIDNADIIHLKGDELPKTINNKDLLIGVNIPRNKPRIITVGGSFFRRGDSDVAMSLYPISKYIEMTDFRSSLTPDLNYPEFQGHYIPHAYDNIKNKWKDKSVKIISHCPGLNNKKGTKEFLEACELLKDKIAVDIIKDVSHTECLERKAESTIFFDEASGCGWFGMSGIEAISMGIPTISYLSDEAIERSDGNCPVINCGNTVEGIKKAIEKCLNSDLQELSNKTFSYAKETYSYKVIGEKWGKIYDSL